MWPRDRDQRISDHEREVVQDAPGDIRVRDRGKDAPRRAAGVALENIDREGPAQKAGPVRLGRSATRRPPSLARAHPLGRGQLRAAHRADELPPHARDARAVHLVCSLVIARLEDNLPREELMLLSEADAPSDA